MNKTLTLLSCTLLFFSCASLKSLDVNKISGLYQGDFPCEDCRGIKTSILLNPDFTYEKTDLFLGQENSFRQNKGNWRVENDSTLSLNENGIQKSFRIRKNSLLNVNTEGKAYGNDFLKVDLNIKAEGDYSDQETKGTHFFATGNEPFWSLEIVSEKSINFTLMGAKPITSKDLITSYKNGVITIKNKSKKPLMEVAIYNYQCVNDMSGAVSSNYVEVKVNNQLYKGCGRSLNNDFEISGKWNLMFIKDFDLPKSNSSKKPFINFNIQEQNINGHLGCNGFGGSYAIINNNINFSKIISTLMACPNMETENKFSSALHTVDSYKIVNNELQLYKEKELLLSFSR